MSTTLLLAHSCRLLREGLCALLAARDDVKIVAEVGDGPTAVELAGSLTPNIAVLDLTLPGLNGVDATHRILRKAPMVKVIILASQQQKHLVSEGLKAGASGLLWTDGGFEELEKALEAVQEERTYFSAGVADMVISQYVRNNGNGSNISLLTSRQREVLQLLAEGQSVKEIGYRLKISPKTVATHRQDLMTKLNISSTAEITKYAIREGLITL